MCEFSGDFSIPDIASAALREQDLSLSPAPSDLSVGRNADAVGMSERYVTRMAEVSQQSTKVDIKNLPLTY